MDLIHTEGRTPSRSSATPARSRPPAARRAFRSPAVRTALAVAAILCVGAVDELSGTDSLLIVFYLLPIAFGTWFVDRRTGLLLCAVAAGVSFAADGFPLLHAGAHDPRVAVLAWNGMVQVATSVALVLMLAAFRARLEGERLLARTDALTQIANRRAFLEAANLEIERARRRNRPLTLAYVDVDDLKGVNDRLGHAQGDAVLVCVARNLQAQTRAVDVVARLGGDEFGLLLPETDAIEADALLGRLRAALLAGIGGNGWHVGVSIGTATFLSPPGSIDEMMARADELMYAAKRGSKGSIRLGVFPGAGSGATAGGVAVR